MLCLAFDGRSGPIPDVTETPYGAHRIAQRVGGAEEPTRRPRWQDNVKGGRLESAAMQSILANSQRQ